MACGIGPAAAGKAAGLLLFRNIDCLISWGTAGALTGDVHTGDLIIPEYIHAESGDLFKTDSVCSCNLMKKLDTGIGKIHTGILAETGSVLENSTQKSNLSGKTGAMCATATAPARYPAITHLPRAGLQVVYRMPLR